MEVWIAWLRASALVEHICTEAVPGVCCRRATLSPCKSTYLKLESSVCWAPRSFKDTFIHLWIVLLMQSKPQLWFEANKAHTVWTLPLCWADTMQLQRGGGEGFPKLCCCLHLHCLPTSLLCSVTHHWRIHTKPHEFLLSLFSLCFYLLLFSAGLQLMFLTAGMRLNMVLCVIPS